MDSSPDGVIDTVVDADGRGVVRQMVQNVPAVEE